MEEVEEETDDSADADVEEVAEEGEDEMEEEEEDNRSGLTTLYTTTESTLQNYAPSAPFYVCSDNQFSAKVHSCPMRVEEDEPLPSSCPGNFETPHNHPPPKHLGNELAAFRWFCKVKLDEDPDCEVKDVVSSPTPE